MSSDHFIPLAEPDLRGNEGAYLSECIRTGWVSSAGPYVTAMEKQLGEMLGCAHVVATASGTTALQLVLEAMELARGTRVVLPDWTFAATVNAVIHAGLTPVLVDVSADHWGLDPALVERELKWSKESGAPVGAVIVVDPIGLPYEADHLNAVCARYGVPVVEDAAGALGSNYNGKPAGGLADAGILSFNGNKIVTGGGGGAIVTNRRDWADRARHLSTQARASDRYAYDAVGFNCRLTNLNAAVVVAQLERLGEMRDARRAIAARYDDAVAERDDLRGPPKANWDDWNGWMYVARTASAAEADRLAAHLHGQAIGARPFWTRLSTHAPYQSFARQSSEVSEKLSGTLVSLPCGSNMTDAEVTRVVRALNSWRGAPLAW